MQLPTLAHDKANHFFYGAVIAALGALITITLGAVLCVAFAGGKEVYDRLSKRGTPEWLDFFWTVLGGAVVYIPLLRYGI